MAITRKTDLRTGTPVWRSYRHSRIESQRLTRSQNADVIIIGAGMSGSLLAWSLTQAGFKPVILDRRGPSLGSTAANTALIQSEIDTPLLHLQRQIGKRAAQRAWQASFEAVQALRQHARTLGVPCIASRPSLYLAGNVLDARGLAREARARQAIGLPAELIDRRGLLQRFDLHRDAAIAGYGNAAADPLHLAGTFLQAALREGARLYAPEDAIDFNCGSRKVVVATHSGHEITARHLVLCTGYELPTMVPTDQHRVVSTWAIATRPQPAKLWPDEALVWEASDPYLYARATPDGRIICGGEDEEFRDEERRDALIARKTKMLEKKLAKLWPHADPRAAFAWTGSFGSSSTGLPTIGAIPGLPRCHVVLGFGGNGTTYAMLAAQLITRSLSGRPSPDAKLFAFS